MKKLTLCAALLALAACAPKNTERTVTLANPTETPRADESVVLTRTELAPVDEKLPAVKNAAGEYVASQVDDLDGDGAWDELAFVTDLAANETVELKIVWLAAAEYPQFPARTNIRYGKMVRPGVIEEQTSDMHYKDEVYYINTEGYPYQMDGVAWENDFVAFRHYYDGRNNKDFFGKRTTDMVLDKVGIREDGTPGDTYHVWADWGRDIMSVGTSFGVGGLGAWVGDSTFVRLGRVDKEQFDVIDSTGYRLIFEGPVRSRFALDFYGWQIQDNKVDLTQETTIWAGKHNYDNKVIAPSLPAGVSLVTGFLYNFNDMPLEELDFETSIGMATHDFQTYNKEFIMGVGMILPKTGVEKLMLSTDYLPEETFSRTWFAKLKLDAQGVVEYKAYAAWEHQDERFKEREAFLDLIRTEGARLDKPVVVTLK